MENQLMEMDTDQFGVENSKSVKNLCTSDIEVSLHAMVILNISECHTRTIVQNSSNSFSTLVGALIGKHQGRKIEILNSYELLLKKRYINKNANGIKMDDDGSDQNNEDIALDSSGECSTSQGSTDLTKDLEIDENFFESKVEQYKQVFPDYELLGWFTIGEEIDDFDKDIFYKIREIHGKTSEKFSENPLVLKLNPLKNCTKTLPVKVYESYLQSFDNTTVGHVSIPEVCFNEVPVSLETEDGEKIVLDHIAENHGTSGGNGNPSVSERLRIQSRAVRMLRDGVKLIIDFIEDAQQNNVQIDQDILRQISFIANRLPMCSPNGEFENDLNVQFNDNALLIYLGTLTKCSATINKFVTRLNSFMPERVIRRRPY